MYVSSFFSLLLLFLHSVFVLFTCLFSKEKKKGHGFGVCGGGAGEDLEGAGRGETVIRI